MPMLGLLSLPGHGASAPTSAVAIVNGGAQYRAGAHRLFLSLARQLAAQGHAVLRFDLPGQGDSPGEPVHFEGTAPHIGAAIDALHWHLPQLQHTTLLGLCDGASASLLYLHARPDPRVTHLLLLNPWIQSDVSQAKAQVKHYYRQRLLMPAFWKKLLRGGVAWPALRELLQQIRTTRRAERTDQDNPSGRMAKAWAVFPGHIGLVLSDSDQTAQTFQEELTTHVAWRHWDQHPRLHTLVLHGADHTFSPPLAKEHLWHWVADSIRAQP